MRAMLCKMLNPHNIFKKNWAEKAEEDCMKPYESHESEENYLEAILMLSLDHRKVRAIDIANMLGFSKPSVSG